MPAVVRQKQALTIVTAFRPVKNRQPAVIAGIVRPEIKRQSSADFESKSQVSNALSCKHSHVEMSQCRCVAFSSFASSIHQRMTVSSHQSTDI